MKRPKLIRFKTWYWGKYVENGSYLDGQRVTHNTPGFEEYIELKHGWKNSEEYKKSAKVF